MNLNELQDTDLESWRKSETSSQSQLRAGEDLDLKVGMSVQRRRPANVPGNSTYLAKALKK